VGAYEVKEFPVCVSNGCCDGRLQEERGVVLTRLLNELNTYAIVCMCQPHGLWIYHGRIMIRTRNLGIAWHGVFGIGRLVSAS
jgi:hypothetical protein